MKRSFAFTAAVAAALALNSCTVTVDNSDTSGELLYRSSRADNYNYDSRGPVVGQPPAEYADTEISEEGIVMPEDNKLTVLIGDDHEKLQEPCNGLIESHGGELTIEVAHSETLYDTLAKGKISDKQIDVSTFDNGMLFPYLAAEGVAAPIDSEISMPALSDDLWSVAEMFTLNNWHYVMPLGYEQAYRLLYDTKTIEKYKLDDPASIKDNDWTVEKLCELAQAYHRRGGKLPLSGNYGEPIHISTGAPLAVYESDPSGFFSNLFDPHMADTTELLFNLKEKEMTMDSHFASAKEALEKDVLFYAATSFEAREQPLPDTVKTVAVPTLKGLDRHYEIKVYGLTLMEKSKHKAAAECYFECAAEICEGRPGGALSSDYRLNGLNRTVYPYDKGISPGVSYSPAHMNEDLSLAVSPLIYTGLEGREDWGGVCTHYSMLFVHDLTYLNNKIRKDIYGD